MLTSDDIEIVVYPVQTPHQRHDRPPRKRKRCSPSQKEIHDLRRRYLIQDHTPHAFKSIALLGKHSNITPFIKRSRNGIKLKLDDSESEDENAVLHEEVVSQDVNLWARNSVDFEGGHEISADSASDRLSENTSIVSGHLVAPIFDSRRSSCVSLAGEPFLQPPLTHCSVGTTFRPRNVGGLPPRRAAQYIELYGGESDGHTSFETSSADSGSPRGCLSNTPVTARIPDYLAEQHIAPRSPGPSTPRQSFKKSSQFISPSQLAPVQQYSGMQRQFPFGQVLTSSMSSSGQHLRKVSPNSTETSVQPVITNVRYAAPTFYQKPRSKAPKSFSKIPSYFM